MEENPIPIYVIEFLSEEWITWTVFSILVISIPLILARVLNRDQKKLISYIMGVIMIIDFISENVGYFISGTWDIEYNLPLHLCGICLLYTSPSPRDRG